jgi:transposase
MGPESAKSYAGHVWIATQPPQVDETAPAVRAQMEADYGRRGKGYVFGAFAPHTGDAFTHCYERRTGANFADFLDRTDQWLHTWTPQGTKRIVAILDNLRTHRTADVLLFSLSHPDWEFLFQPVYAAYLNLIEPWWKVLRSLALKGKRFETWAQVEQAIADATRYWNRYRHPFHWGNRRRHKVRRQTGIALVPSVR